MAGVRCDKALTVDKQFVIVLLNMFMIVTLNMFLIVVWYKFVIVVLNMLVMHKHVNVYAKAFKSYVRPILEYCSSVWSPFLIET